MSNDIRDEEVTPENEKLLLVGRAKGKKIWDRIRNDVEKLDEPSAYVCMHDLIIRHIGYSEGRWPGSAKELIPTILDLLEDDDETED